MQDRREFLGRGSAVVAGLLATGWTVPSFAGRDPSSRIPLVHITDLYHPPQDPDDHFDLATIAALPEFDLRGVILDVTQKFLDPAPTGWDIARDPGFIPVVQLGHILGRAIPVAAGPSTPLASVSDDLQGRPATQRAGVSLLLEILEASPAPVVLSVVGSARVVAAAFNRAPDLVRAKTRAVMLNAGSTGGPKKEWNVGLDEAAYVCLWRSGLPVHWYPCATPAGAFDPAHERGTYWKASQAVLLRSLTPPMRAWFAYALSDSRRGDIMQYLAEQVDDISWKRVLREERNMWATASLVMAAGRSLMHTDEGWRFIPAKGPEGCEHWSWRLDPISASVDDAGSVTWALAGDGSHHRLFGRDGGPGFGTAMADALGALLGTIG